MQAVAIATTFAGLYAALSLFSFATRPRIDTLAAISLWTALAASIVSTVALAEFAGPNQLLLIGAVSIPVFLLAFCAIAMRAGLELSWNQSTPRFYANLKRSLESAHPLLMLSPLLIVVCGVAVGTTSLMSSSWVQAYIALFLLSEGIILSWSLTFVYLRAQSGFDAARWLALATSDTVETSGEAELKKLLNSENVDERLAAVLLISKLDVKTGARALSDIREPVDSREREPTPAILNDIEGSGLIKRAIGPTYEIYLEQQKTEGKLTQELFQVQLEEALGELWWPKHLSENVEEVWQKLPLRLRTTLRFKRLFDYTVGFSSYILFHPLIPIFAWLIGRSYGEDQRFFVTTRLGRHGKPFPYIRLNVVALRSTGITWISGLGAFLLRSGLDRIPALANILAGEMSFIGPMPLSLAALDRLREDSDAPDLEDSLVRLAVPLGLTGPAQQFARRDKKAHRCAAYGAYDVEYVQALSAAGDLRIIVEEGSAFLAGLPMHAFQAIKSAVRSASPAFENEPEVLPAEITDAAINQAKVDTSDFTAAVLSRSI